MFKHVNLGTKETYNVEKDSLLIEFPWGGNIHKTQKEELEDGALALFRMNEGKRLVNIEVIGYSKVATPEGKAKYNPKPAAEPKPETKVKVKDITLEQIESERPDLVDAIKGSKKKPKPSDK